MKVRATGVLIEDNKILLVQQKVTPNRAWSLPGGTLEEGESLEKCLIRELKEETGLEMKVDKLLYLCDRITSEEHVLHITFQILKSGGSLQLQSGKYDQNTITDVRMVEINQLKNYGFSADFAKLVKEGFPNAGNYMGIIENIGL